MKFKNIKISLLLCILIITLSGCNNNNDTSMNNKENIVINDSEKITNDNDKEINDKLIELQTKNEELEEKNKELEDKLSSLETKINDLDSKTDNYKNDYNTNYNNLEKKINNFNCDCNNSTNKNTITKDVLMTIWYENDGDTFDFNDWDNVEILGNFIIIDNSMAIYYEYIDEKLYISDDGLVLHK